MRYFAYGSNLFSRRLRARVPGASFESTASLPSYALRFHKRSRDGSAKCKIIPSDEPNTEVIGAIFDVPDDQKQSLDDAEALGHGYHEEQLTVLLPDGVAVCAMAYVADESAIDESRAPYEWYLAHVLAGAHEHGLPESYVAALVAIPAISDPDVSRHSSEMACHGEMT